MAISGIAIGDGGGIAVAEELVAYGTPGATKVWQHAKSAALNNRKTIRPPKQLATVKPAARSYTPDFADGPIVLAYDDKRSVIEPIMNNLGNLTGDDYVIGDGSAPDTNSVSVYVDTGGHLMEYLGAKATKVRWDFADGEVVMTVDYLTKSGSKISTVSITTPTEADIIMGADLGTITLGTNSLCVLSGYIEVTIPHEGTDRICLGSATIKEPMRLGYQDVTAQLNVELSDETDNDTEAELDHFFAGTTAGDLVIGDFEVTACYVMGDAPTLQTGITKFPLNLEGQYLTVTTKT